MADIRVQVEIPYYTGVPEDVCVNSWSFTATSTTTAPERIGPFLGIIYGALVDDAHPILDFTNARGKFYDRADPEPRTPFFEAEFDLGNANIGNEGLPEEVTSCLSFRGVYASGSSKARRRGRLYLPPVGTAVLAEGGGGRTVVSSAWVDLVLDAYEAAWAELDVSGDAHVVWSPTNSESYPVVEAWMDNAFDTQRRRGIRATVRETRPGPW